MPPRPTHARRITPMRPGAVWARSPRSGSSMRSPGSRSTTRTAPTTRRASTRALIHALCVAHIQRELRGIAEHDLAAARDGWAAELDELIENLFRWRETWRDDGHEQFPTFKITKIHREWDDLLERALMVHPHQSGRTGGQTHAPPRGPPARPQAGLPALARRLRDPCDQQHRRAVGPDDQDQDEDLRRVPHLGRPTTIPDDPRLPRHGSARTNVTSSPTYATPYKPTPGYQPETRVVTPTHHR